MISLKKRQSGFTIVELLIVIVVIGILATLVIVTFTGIQQKARDSQRQTDIQALNNHLAAYYAQNGTYPSLAVLTSTDWAKTNMKGLDAQALVDPKGGAIAATAGADHYGYDAKAGGAACTDTGSGTAATSNCDSYTLTAVLEAGGTYTKSSN
jgi:prepilin-type N-terminal cleavage/methylation domain-containing protein